MSNAWLEDQWRSELTARFASAAIEGSAGQVLLFLRGADLLEWKPFGRDRQELFIDGRQEYHFDRNGVAFLEPSRDVLKNRYLPILNECGIGVDMDDVDALLRYIDPSAEHHKALEGFYVWRMSFIINAVDDIAYRRCLQELGHSTFDLSLALAALFDNNQGNWFLLSTIVTKHYDHEFIQYDHFYKHGNYAYNRRFLSAALALYKRVPSLAGRSSWEHNTYYYRCCLLSLYENNPAYEEYFKIIETGLLSTLRRDHLFCFRHFRRGELVEAVRYCEQYLPHVDWYSDLPEVTEYLFGYIHIDCLLQRGQEEEALDLARHYWKDLRYNGTLILNRVGVILNRRSIEEVARILSDLVATDGSPRMLFDSDWTCMQNVLKQNQHYEEDAAWSMDGYDANFRHYVLHQL